MNRAAMKPLEVSEVIGQFKKRFSKKYCLHPEAGDDICAGDIVRAHTIQRAGLEKIASGGHVYGMPKHFGTLMANNGRLTFRRMGIKKASTFTGFCNRHDTETFAPIENEPFQVCQEHLFLLGYRALCYEIFTKQASIELEPVLRDMDRGRPFRYQVALQQFVTAFVHSAKIGRRDQLLVKKRYDRILQSKDFSEVRYYVLELEDLPDVMCSGCIYPSFDFHGNTLQDLGDPSRNLENISLSIIPNDRSGGIAAFAWIGEGNGACEALIRSLDSYESHAVGHAIIRFVFEFLENKFFRIEWWDGLGSDVQDRLKKRGELARNVMVDRLPDCLADDGVRAVDWRIVRREANL